MQVSFFFFEGPVGTFAVVLVLFNKGHLIPYSGQMQLLYRQNQKIPETTLPEDVLYKKLFVVFLLLYKYNGSCNTDGWSDNLWHLSCISEQVL